MRIFIVFDDSKPVFVSLDESEASAKMVEVADQVRASRPDLKEGAYIGGISAVDFDYGAAPPTPPGVKANILYFKPAVLGGTQRPQEATVVDLDARAEKK